MQFDHVGLVSLNLEKTASELMMVLPIVKVSQRFDDSNLGVSVQFFKDTAGFAIEVIMPFGENSPIKKLAQGEQKLNQICYRCESLLETSEKLRGAGSVPLGIAKSALAFDGALVQFFWINAGFILELVEGVGDARRYVPPFPK